MNVRPAKTQIKSVDDGKWKTRIRWSVKKSPKWSVRTERNKPDQPEHLPSLIRVYAVRFMSSQGSQFFFWWTSKTDQTLRLPRLIFIIRWAHMSLCLYRFWRVPTQLLGIVEALRVKIYAVFSFPARSTMYRTCSFVRKNDSCSSLHMKGLFIKACIRRSHVRGYLFSCSPEINRFVPLFPK